MSKKTIVFLVGVVAFALAGIAVYAATDTSQAPTNDTSITSVEVANTEACSQDCCKDCDGNCEDCDNCDKPCKGHGGRCGGHGDGDKGWGCGPGRCGGN